MSDNEKEAAAKLVALLERDMVTVPIAGGMLCERADRLPEQSRACGAEALQGEVADFILSGPGKTVNVLLIGLIAAGCMIDQGIAKPTAPPTPDGAFDVFHDWASVEGRSLGDLRRVYNLAADGAAQTYVVFEAAVLEMKRTLAQGDSDVQP